MHFYSFPLTLAVLGLLAACVSAPTFPRHEIHTVQSTPLRNGHGAHATNDSWIESKGLNGKMLAQLRNEFRIRYDDQGVVQKLCSPLTNPIDSGLL